MSDESIKKQLHSYINDITDEAALQLLHEAAEAYCKKKGDIIDLLNTQQKQDLQESLQQVKEGKVVANSEVSKMAKEWLTK